MSQQTERDLISERTREGLIAARAKGRILGRPKGSFGPSRLDGKESEIKMLLHKKGHRQVNLNRLTHGLFRRI